MPAEKYVFSPAAYAKTVLHATNYPAYAVSGLFLGKAEKVGDKTVLYVDDTLPLFHTFNQLTPMVSVGIEHGQILGEANGCKVVCLASGDPPSHPSHPVQFPSLQCTQRRWVTTTLVPA